MLISGWQDPATAGAVWIALQSITVAGFAALQIAGLRPRALSGARRGRGVPARGRPPARARAG